MTRPANPTYPIQPFAPDVNYPAGGDPWNSNPTKVTPPGASSVGFVPNQGNAAQFHNWIHNIRGVENAAAKAYVGSVVDWTAQSAALTFHTESVFTNLFALKYSPALRVWLGSGGTDMFRRTGDILAWPASTEIPAPQQCTQEAFDFDVDPAGNIVLIPGAIAAVQECSAAGTWALHTGVLDNLTAPNVVYEPVSAKWVVVGKVAGANKAWNSSDRVTWPAKTAPSVTGGSYMTLGTNGTGRIVLQAYDGGTNIQFQYSDDAGVTWSAPQTFALGFTQKVSGVFRFPKPVWNGSCWLACAFSGGTASKVFKSTDGATWTNVATFTGAAICSLAAIGELWMGITPQGEYLASVDGGTTWRYGDRKITTGGPVLGLVAANAMRFVMTTTAKVYVGGTAAGLGGSVAT